MIKGIRIKTRHVSLQGNTSRSSRYGRQALAQTAIAPADIAIIVTTFTPDGLAPSTTA